MNESTDTPQMAYLRRLAEKRNRAFEADTEFEREIIAAFRKTTGREYSRPIRTNEPLMGEIGYEREAPAPIAWYERVDWPELLGTIGGVLIVVAIAGACCIAFLRATQGWAR